VQRFNSYDLYSICDAPLDEDGRKELEVHLAPLVERYLPPVSSW
jgi:hypothetical protein